MKPGESIQIGDTEIYFKESKGTRVKLAVKARKNVKIQRIKT